MLVLAAFALAAAPVDPVAQVEPAAPTAPPIAPADPYLGWSREQLQTERDRIDAKRPSLKLPIALFIAGGATVIVSSAVMGVAGFYTWFLNSSSLFGGGGRYNIESGFIIAYAVVALVGLAAVIAGIAVTVPTVAKRREFDPELKRVDDAIDRMEPREQPPPGEAPPPPPGPAPAPLPVQPAA